MAVRGHLAWFATALALCGGFVVFLREHDARVRAEFALKDAQGRISERKEQAESQVKAMQERAKHVKTPAQAIEAIPQVVNLPLPIRRLDSLPGVSIAPDAPSAVKNSAVVEEPSIKPLYDKLEQCAEEHILFGACQANEKEYERVMKGVKGTVFQRMKAGAKHSGCGVVGGGAGVAVGQKDARAGVVLGFGSYLLCELLVH